MTSQPVILFDGVCNLCNKSVLFVIKHDPRSIFKFASLQSETGRSLLGHYGLSANDLNSFILIMNDKAYTRSTAVLKVTQYLSGPARLLYGFIIVPAFIRNGIYNLIAGNRYKWFGKKDSCMVPSPSLEARFLN